MNLFNDIDSVEMMARRNCASILLAHESSSPATSGGGGRSYSSPLEGLYKCKDCDRTFNTFQALGGHRASHMKLRLTNQQDSGTGAIGSVAGGVKVARPARVKVHECRQCRERFPTGQALGGHMRKHAGSSAKRKCLDSLETFRGFEGSEKKRSRVVLQLDLNFPPPGDEPLLQLACRKGNEQT